MLKQAKKRIHQRLKIQGLEISIENPKGSIRRWHDPHGKETGSTKMKWGYGYIRRTEGTDGDHVDVYVGPEPESPRVFIVNQMKKPESSKKGDGQAWTKFDEQKVMLGWSSPEAAKAAYMAQYDDPRFFGSMTEMDIEAFKAKVLSKEHHGKKVASAIFKSFSNHLKLAFDEKAARRVLSAAKKIQLPKAGVGVITLDRSRPPFIGGIPGGRLLSIKT